MKKLTIAALVASVATGGVASAEFGDKATFNLKATVGSVCGVAQFAGLERDIDFGDLADDPTTAGVNGVSSLAGSSISYICNSPNGFTRTISSTNGGVMLRTGGGTGGADSIAYKMSHTGGSGLGFNDISLSTDRVDNLGGSTAFLNGQTAEITFTTAGVLDAGEVPNEGDRTTVFAGDYTDTVTITVTPL